RRASGAGEVHLDRAAVRPREPLEAEHLHLEEARADLRLTREAAADRARAEGARLVEAPGGCQRARKLLVELHRRREALDLRLEARDAREAGVGGVVIPPGHGG